MAVESDGRGMGREVGEETYDLLISHAELFTYGGIERHQNESGSSSRFCYDRQVRDVPAAGCQCHPG